MKWIAILCFVIILVISVIDEYCLLQYVTYENEFNPIGKLLIAIGGIPLFATTKMLGTVVAFALLVHGCHVNFKFTLVILIILALVQLTLLWYLFA